MIDACALYTDRNQKLNNSRCGLTYQANAATFALNRWLEIARRTALADLLPEFILETLSSLIARRRRHLPRVRQPKAPGAKEMKS
jgi:hypothetical protein